MDDALVPPLVTVGLAALLVVAGGLVSLVPRRAARGRLPRNPLVGLRTPATSAGDEAWRAGHAAGRRLSDRSGLAFALTGLAALAVDEADDLTVLVLVGTAVGTGLLLGAAWQAERAARSADRGAWRGRGAGDLPTTS